MEIKQKLKEFVVGTLIVGALLGGAPQTKAASLDAVVGNQGIELDLKATGNIAPKINVFNRNLINTGYNNQVGYFGFTDLSLKLVEGLDLVAETQYAPGTGVVPRIGLQYFKSFGDFSAYVLGTVGANKNPNGEAVTILTYNPKLGEKLGLFLGAENVTNFGKDGHNFSSQKLKSGLSFGKNSEYQVGAAANLSESQGKTNYNLGGYMGVKF